MMKKMRRVGRMVNRAGKSSIGRALINGAIAASPYASQIRATRKLVSGRGLYRGRGLYTGAGEYIADSNDLITGQSKSSMSVVPQFARESDSGTVVSRREYVSEIYGPPLVGGVPQPFVIQSFSLNPGLEGTFPWLSQIAMNYDEYEITQLIFTFKSTTTESSNTTNGQVGTVIMATNYNAAAPVFTDKVTMMQYAFANSGKLTESLQHGVECDPTKLSGSAGEYIRNNPVVSNQDLKTYDHGKFQIAVANCAASYANVSIGELWVSYTVKLRKPKFYEALGLGITKDIFVSAANSGTTGLLPFGTNILRGQQNNLGCRVSNTGALNCSITIVFPASYKGRLKLLWSLQGTGMSLNRCTAVLGGNVAGVQDLFGSAGIGDATLIPLNTLSTMALDGHTYLLHVDVNISTNGVDNSVVLTAAAIPATVTQCYLDISEYNGGFSYLATGIGSGLDPVFTTANGIVTLPY